MTREPLTQEEAARRARLLLGDQARCWRTFSNGACCRIGVFHQGQLLVLGRATSFEEALAMAEASIATGPSSTGGDRIDGTVGR